MAADEPTNRLAESGVTMHSDSERYSAGEELSTSPPSSNSPVILYQSPTVWSLIRGAAINLFLPFVNGMMLGFGELFAHEAAFRLGWGGTKLWYFWELALTVLGLSYVATEDACHRTRNRDPRATREAPAIT